MAQLAPRDIKRDIKYVISKEKLHFSVPSAVSSETFIKSFSKTNQSLVKAS